MRKIQIILLFSAIFANSVHAAPKLYGEVDAMRTEIKGAGSTFKPYNAKFKGGFYLRNKVALEVQYVNSGNADDNGANLEINKLYGGFLRLESDLHNRVRIYLLGGYAQTDLHYTDKLVDIKEKGEGFAWGIGAEDQMVRFRNAYFTLEYMNYYSKDGFDISGISFGVRYVF